MKHALNAYVVNIRMIYMRTYMVRCGVLNKLVVVFYINFKLIRRIVTYYRKTVSMNYDRECATSKLDFESRTDYVYIRFITDIIVSLIGTYCSKTWVKRQGFAPQRCEVEKIEKFSSETCKLISIVFGLNPLNLPVSLRPWALVYIIYILYVCSRDEDTRG